MYPFLHTAYMYLFVCTSFYCVYLWMYKWPENIVGGKGITGAMEQHEEAGDWHQTAGGATAGKRSSKYPPKTVGIWRPTARVSRRIPQDSCVLLQLFQSLRRTRQGKCDTAVRRCYYYCQISEALAVVVSVCLSVCLSVTLLYCIETTKDIIRLFLRCHSSFWSNWALQNSKGTLSSGR